LILKVQTSSDVGVEGFGEVLPLDRGPVYAESSLDVLNGLQQKVADRGLLGYLKHGLVNLLKTFHSLRIKTSIRIKTKLAFM